MFWPRTPSATPMSSPAKKRKLNNGTKSSGAPSRGLEYFFSKQRQNGAENTSRPAKSAPSGSDAATGLTDEELARKLQAEWDEELASERQADRSGSRSTPIEENGSLPSEEKTRISEPKPTLELPSSLAKPLPLGIKPTNTLTLQSAGISEDTTSILIPLDESPLTFEPSKYIPQLKAHWESEAGDASYALLTRCFVLVSGTTSRIKIVDTLVNFLRVMIEADPSSLLPAVGTQPNHVDASHILRYG